ncbi:unnamed protein product, partial [Effrenium voratum]
QYPLLCGRQLSPWQAKVNVTANLLGVATLALPWAFAEAGLLGAVVLAVVAKTSHRTWQMLLELSAFDGQLVGRASYPEIGRRVLGVEGHLAVLVALVFFAAG